MYIYRTLLYDIVLNIRSDYEACIVRLNKTIGKKELTNTT